MDRDELQERIRARRTGGDPYRRGGAPDERGGYERFEPDPADARARRTTQPNERRRDLFDDAAGAAAPAATEDLTRERDDWARPAAAPTPAAAPPPAYPYAPPPSDVPLGDEEDYAEPAYEEVGYAEPAHVDNYDDEAYDAGDYRHTYDEWEEARGRRAGGGALAILGFLALGVLALLGGALLAGLFSGDANVGQVTDTPSPSASASASVAAIASASAAPSGTAGTSASPGASGEPVVFPDGFTAEAQPCIPGSANIDGCDSNGATNSGSVWIWVGFKNGTDDDVIGVTLTLPDGRTEDGSIDLAQIGCSPTCPGGWTYFPFSGLPPGTYQVEIARNGEHAGSTSFEVT